MQPEIFDTVSDLAAAVADRFADAARAAHRDGRALSVALSGGNTPRSLFEELASGGRRDRIPWEAVHLFWGDERCVPPDHQDSNFRMTREILLDKISIPETNIHRIRGENEPVAEAGRYSDEIVKILGTARARRPRFDWILLGMGVDGHTASLFPGSPILSNEKNVCAVAEHPETGQKRITLTLPVLNNAARVSFLVTGKKKAEIVARILGMVVGSADFPASLVKPENGTLELFLDRQAAAKIPHS
jgi:6-phosphogluconolactonase